MSIDTIYILASKTIIFIIIVKMCRLLAWFLSINYLIFKAPYDPLPFRTQRIYLKYLVFAWHFLLVELFEAGLDWLELSGQMISVHCEIVASEVVAAHSCID